MLWLSSCLVGALIFGYFAWRLDAVRVLVETAIRAEDPTASESSVQTAVNTTIAVSLGLIVLSVSSKMLLALLMALRRSWTRVVLAILGVVTAPLTTVAATVLTGGTVESRNWLLLALAAQEVLMLGGLVTMFVRPSTVWLRGRLPG